MPPDLPLLDTGRFEALINETDKARNARYASTWWKYSEANRANGREMRCVVVSFS